MNAYTGMISKRARSFMETKTMLNELAERAKQVEDITGEAIDPVHAMSVISGILDSETLKYTADLQGGKTQKQVDELVKKATEFANLMVSGSKEDHNNIGMVGNGTAEKVEGDEQWPQEQWPQGIDRGILRSEFHPGVCIQTARGWPCPDLELQGTNHHIHCYSYPDSGQAPFPHLR